MVVSERRLWRAVLEQAYEDAEEITVGDGSAIAPILCTRARRYLRGEDAHEMEDLGIVCEFADVPADRVLSWARQRHPLAE